MTRSLSAIICTFGFALVGLAQAPIPPKPAPSPDVDQALESFKAGKFDDAHDRLKKACAANLQLQPPRVILAGKIGRAHV